MLASINLAAQFPDTCCYELCLTLRRLVLSASMKDDIAPKIEWLRDELHLSTPAIRKAIIKVRSQ
jgi:hypothetical protein